MPTEQSTVRWEIASDTTAPSCKLRRNPALQIGFSVRELGVWPRGEGA